MYSYPNHRFRPGTEDRVWTLKADLKSDWLFVVRRDSASWRFAFIDDDKQASWISTGNSCKHLLCSRPQSCCLNTPDTKQHSNNHSIVTANMFSARCHIHQPSNCFLFHLLLSCWRKWLFSHLTCRNISQNMWNRVRTKNCQIRCSDSDRINIPAWGS